MSAGVCADVRIDRVCKQTLKSKSTKYPILTVNPVLAQFLHFMLVRSTAHVDCDDSQIQSVSERVELSCSENPVPG